MKLSLTDCCEAIEETTKDLMAFRSSFNAIHNRVMQVRDEGKEHFLSIVNWSGTSGTMGILDLSIHAIERRRTELLLLKKKMVENNLDEIEIPEDA